MNILVFSDTHGDHQAYQDMMAQVSDIDHIYCLGDSGFSYDFLESNQIVSVRGNYPFAPDLPYALSEKWFHHHFFLTHGHKYHVKFGLSKLMRRADILRMDLCLFGHTHKAFLEKKGALILLNPGALSYSRSFLYPSYAKIMIDENHLSISIINLKTNEIMKTYNEEKHD
jgi:hypothetical protein